MHSWRLRAVQTWQPQRVSKLFMPIRMLSSLSTHSTWAPLGNLPLSSAALAGSAACARARGTLTLNTLPRPGHERTRNLCPSTRQSPSAIASPSPRPFSARV
ncbi:hypothetical protein D3C73_1239600 [compost metagenome]